MPAVRPQVAPTANARLIDEHLTRRPLMAPADVYKLLYQGVLGPEHLVTSPGDFAARLEEQGYPAVHHSMSYRETCRPAYRLAEYASGDEDVFKMGPS